MGIGREYADARIPSDQFRKKATYRVRNPQYIKSPGGRIRRCYLDKWPLRDGSRFDEQLPAFLNDVIVANVILRLQITLEPLVYAIRNLPYAKFHCSHSFFLHLYSILTPSL